MGLHLTTPWDLPVGWWNDLSPASLPGGLLCYQTPHPPSSLPLTSPSTPSSRTIKPFFALIDWSQIPERSIDRPWSGPKPQPRHAFLKALLLQISQHLEHSTDLRSFLLLHPALTLSLGFRPALDPSLPDGFDIKRTVPSARHFRRLLLSFDPVILQQLFGATVDALLAAHPAFGDSVAIDVKHLYAYVRENNPRESIPQRYNPQRQPKGDPDCRLGAKPTYNRGTPVPAHSQAPPSSPQAAPSGSKAQKEWLWGYGTGICVARDEHFGEVVLAEETRPFNQHDSQYGLPLLRQTRERLGRGPKRCSADSAYDAWYMYEYIDAGGGTAYIPLNTHGAPLPSFGENGRHLCADGREMVAGSRYFDRERGHHVEDERCPLLRPRREGESCRVEHPQWVKGVGCVKHRNTEAGAGVRLEQDRRGDEFREAYKDRTAAERLNSQAKAWGLERPQQRRQSAIANRNTLIYCVINLKALQRLLAKQHGHTP